MSGVPTRHGTLQSESVQLLCLTASSGVPLFSRGSSKQLPFSVIGSLNGVHMFGSGHEAVLSQCETRHGGRVIWRVFHDSLMLIAVSSHADVSELQLRRLLENVWNCMVLVLGLNEVTNVRNVERLKRELRSCYRLIDLLLGRCTEVDGKGIMGDLTHCADCILVSQPSGLQEALDGFTRAVECEFGCLLIHGRLALGTEKWWRLAPQELVLLMMVVNLPHGITSSEYPVYLPQGSPNIAHRLLCFQLLPGAIVCALCGPKTSLYQAGTSLINRFWFPLGENLRSCVKQAELSSLSLTVSLRRDVLALLLINRDSRRSLTTLGPAPSTSRHWELLRRFYTFAETHYFAPEEPPVSTNTNTNTTAHPTHENFSKGFTHQPVHCYLVSDECKCYAIQTPQYELFLLTDLSSPTFALRSIANQTLDALTTATGF